MAKTGHGKSERNAPNERTPLRAKERNGTERAKTKRLERTAM